MQFEVDNDDMESSKRRSIYSISLVFILKCFTKPFIIRNLLTAIISNCFFICRLLFLAEKSWVSCDCASKLNHDLRSIFDWAKGWLVTSVGTDLSNGLILCGTGRINDWWFASHGTGQAMALAQTTAKTMICVLRHRANNDDVCTVAGMSYETDMSSDVMWYTQPIISYVPINNTQHALHLYLNLEYTTASPRLPANWEL